MKIWSEIKQRRITQIVVTYAAGGWMVLAVVDQVVDRGVLPDLAYQVGLSLYLFGIAVALILGWYHGEKGHQKATPVELVLLAVVVLSGLGFTGRMVTMNLRAAANAGVVANSTMDLKRVAVLYFQDESRDGSLGAEADGLTDGLIRSLSEVSALDVVSRNGSERVRGLTVPPDSVASILNAGTLIMGSLAETDDQLKVTVRLVDGQSGTEIQRDQYTWPTSDLASVDDKLAQEVSQSLRKLLGQEIEVREARSHAPSTAAWLQVARAEKALREAKASLQGGKVDEARQEFDLADTELVGAEGADDKWTEPVVLQGRVAYERFNLATTLDEGVATLDTAVAYANKALGIDSNDAEALEVRGTANYRKWLLSPGEDNAAHQALLESARKDLEQAKNLDHTLAASVNSVLSHLYYQESDWQMAVLAARQAYEQDAFLSAADGVLWRLYLASYDLGRYPDARRWCFEGNRRFPDNYRFIQCQIYLMTMDGGDPDVQHAWQLYDSIQPLLPAGQKELLSGIIRTFIGGIIGRAGLPDSANAVYAGAHMGPDVDAGGEQLAMEAAMRSINGDVDGAVQALKEHMVVAPGSFPGEHWWWRNLEGDSAFQRLKEMH